MTRFKKIITESNKIEVLDLGNGLKLYRDVGYDSVMRVRYRLESYYMNGRRHRTNGPAHIIYYENGKVDKFYFVQGKRFSEEEFYKHFGE